MSAEKLQRIIVTINGFRADSPHLDKLVYHEELDTPDNGTLGAKINIALHDKKADFVSVSGARKEEK